MTTDTDLITEATDLLVELPDPLDVPVSALMNNDIVSTPVTTTVRRAAELLDYQGVSLLVLRDGDEVRGVLSERDIVRIVAMGLAVDEPIDRVGGQAELVWAPEGATVNEIALIMMERYVRHVLVADDDGELVGVVSMRDLLSALLD